MNVRRLQLDVDKAVQRPSLLDLAEVMEAVNGVEAVNITATDIDVETIGTEVTVEGDGIDVAAMFLAIERAGAVLHSIDEVVVGNRIVERVPRVPPVIDAMSSYGRPWSEHYLLPFSLGLADGIVNALTHWPQRQSSTAVGSPHGSVCVSAPSRWSPRIHDLRRRVRPAA